MTDNQASPDVVIHVADGLLYEGVDYAARIEQRLRDAALTTARCDLTVSSADEPMTARLHVLTGGTTSVLSDEPWMRSAVETARSLMARADRDECAVVGICLGSQILAEALRPNSIVSSDAIEVGLTTIEGSIEHRVQKVVPAFHYQAITPAIEAVDGVRIAWHNDHTRVQGFRYGNHTVGYQFHPELTTADIHQLIDFNADTIVAFNGDLDEAHRSVERLGSALPDDLFAQLVLDRSTY